MIGLLRHLAPMGSIAVLTLLAVLPWGLPAEDRFFLPLLPVIAIHYWALRHDAVIPEWFVFLAGLVLDTLTNGPLGYWSLIYLIAYSVAVISAPLASRGQGVRMALFAVALLIVAGAAWVISSIYFLEAVDWRPYLTGAAFAGVGALLIVPILHALNVADGERANPSLVRGR